MLKLFKKIDKDAEGKYLLKSSAIFEDDMGIRVSKSEVKGFDGWAG